MISAGSCFEYTELIQLHGNYLCNPDKHTFIQFCCVSQENLNKAQFISKSDVNSPRLENRLFKKEWSRRTHGWPCVLDFQHFRLKSKMSIQYINLYKTFMD